MNLPRTLLGTSKRLFFLKLGMLAFALLLGSSALTLLDVSASSDERNIGARHRDVRVTSKLIPQDEKTRQIIESPILSEFDDWVRQYSKGNFREGSQQLERGRDLSVKRRDLFKELIRLSPKVALEHAISSETRDQLPTPISQNLERRVSAYGDFLVYVVMTHEVHHSTEMMTGSRIERKVVIDGARYEAFVYGRRETMTTKLNIPLQGISLDGWIAVDENPLRRLEPIEYESLSVNMAMLKDRKVVAEVGGTLVYFSNQEEVEHFLREQVEWEAQIGPVRSKRDDQPASFWTEGLKTVLFIRVDFSDKPGDPVDGLNQPLTASRAQSVMDTEVNPFYLNNSYNKTSLQTTVTTVVRMPHPLSFYTWDNLDTMLSDARNSARAAGYETNNFSLDILAFSWSPNLTPLQGALGDKGVWLGGEFSFSTIAHELGHNYGLYHANLWRTVDGTVIGSGSNLEYGNPFDVMGSGRSYAGAAHFNAQYKRRLDWLTDANVQTIISSGDYRVFAHDSSSPGGIRVLKIKKDSSKNYWIEFRQLLTSNPNAFNGAMINWDYLSANFTQTQLLDMTPNTSSDATDAPLMIGQSFNDNENRIRITVLGKGNTTPPSLDVRVELNVGCTFSLGQASQNFSASGGEGNIIANTQSGCSPSATSNDSWLYPIAGDTSPVRYIVAANYDSQPRTGTITVSGQTFTVQQAAATTACVPRPSGLVAWWRGEGDALDQTGVNNGTLLNQVSFGSGKVGGGWKFEGGSGQAPPKVFVPDSASLAFTRSLTVEGWVRLDAQNSGQSNLIIRSDNNNFLGTYSVAVNSSGVMNFLISSSPTGNIASVSSSSGLPLGQFTHFAATLDDSTAQMKLYLNGSVVGQITTTIRPYGALDPNEDAGIGIGNLPSKNASNSLFNGAIDELSLYDRALTASDIQAIYNAGIAGTGAAGKCLSAVAPPPSAPTATAATSLTSSGFTANWSSVSGATGYRLDLSTSSTFSSYLSGYQDLDVGNELSRSVSGLSANTTYYYRVRAYNASGTSGNSGTINLTTTGPPSAPTANAATSVTSSGFTANWSSSTSATGYRLDVSTSNSFSGFLSGYQDLEVGNVVSRNVSGLSANTSYYYRVRAYNASGTSGNSGTISLTTAGPPSVPTANAATSVGTSGFTANWSSSSEATGHRLDVSTSNTFSSFVSGYQDLDVGNVLSRSVSGLSANTTYYYRVRAYNASGTSSNSGTINLTTSSTPSWTNAQGVSVSGNSLTKTASDGWSNAGASSTATISLGDGYLEFAAMETNKDRMCGLSNGDTNQHYSDIEFAIYLAGGEFAWVFEAGVAKGAYVTYQAGDLFRVSVEGGVVKYRKNGTLFYTSTVPPGYPLLADTSLYSTGATITNAVIVSGQPPTVSTTAASSVTGTSAILNGSVNPKGLATTAWFEWGTNSTLTSNTQTSAQAIGSGNSSQAINANLSALQSGTYYFRAVASNSAGQNTGPILSFSAGGPTTEAVVWTNALGVSVSGNNLTKTAGDGWGNAGASSTKGIGSGDGYVEFTATETNEDRMAGLGNGDSSQHYSDIEYAVNLTPGGVAWVFESGVGRVVYTLYQGGDVFRIGVEGGVVKYRKNGTLFYTSIVVPVYPLLLDTSLYTTGATISNAMISGNLQSLVPTLENVAWTNVIGTSASGNSLTKTLSDGWGNAGAVSTRAIPFGDGYVQFTATETNKDRMCGLGRGDSSQHYADIDFAIDLSIGGVAYVFEFGVSKGIYTNYQAGDVFRIAVEGGVVKYSKNGSVFYTSSAAPAYPLLVDTSLNSTGATITNAVVFGKF